MTKRPVRIANFAGMFGDRPSAMTEQLRGGDVDVLCGEYLAELTMLIMARTQARRPDGGYARTFVSQLGPNLGTILERGVKVVVNAGALDPMGCAQAVEEMAAGLGLTPKVAAVDGDDLRDRLASLQSAGETFSNLQTGEDLGEKASELVTANVYLGGWGISEALRQGADVVITGRVADAALVSGPAAWWHDWGRHDYDAIAGATVGGHVVECGCQATGGNYSFFTEVPGMAHPGLPWVEVAADGTCVVGKHADTGGEVSVGTVTSQLLYEIDGPRYLAPDVTVRFDTIDIRQLGPDRVELSGVRGEAPPATLKVAASTAGGFRNSVMIGLTGPNQRAKADLLSAQMWDGLPYGPDDLCDVNETLIGTSADDPASNAAAISYWELAVADHDKDKVGRTFADALIHSGLGSIPGLFGVSPPGPARPFARLWPTTVGRAHVQPVVHVGGREISVPETDPLAGPAIPEIESPAWSAPSVPSGPTVRAPLGAVFAARSGDKGGHANLGVFARSEAAHAWLAATLTTDWLRALLPDLAGFDIERCQLPRLRAVHFFVRGLLGEGVSSSLRVDPQAKGLAEYLRARVVDLPASLLANKEG